MMRLLRLLYLALHLVKTFPSTDAASENAHSPSLNTNHNTQHDASTFEQNIMLGALTKNSTETFFEFSLQLTSLTQNKSDLQKAHDKFLKAVKDTSRSLLNKVDASKSATLEEISEAKVFLKQSIKDIGLPQVCSNNPGYSEENFNKVQTKCVLFVEG